MRPAPLERQQAEQVLQDEGWSHIKLPKDRQQELAFQFADLMKWCEDTVGHGRVEPGPNWLDEEDVWYSFAWYGYWTFHFKHEKDATAFALRWS